MTRSNSSHPTSRSRKGTADVTYTDFPAEKTSYSAVHVKRDGQWLIDRVSEVEVSPPPPSNYEHLKELEWMVGKWVDQDEEATVHTECDWTKHQNFLTRSFALVVGDSIEMSGMQIIGWDPAEKRIRSWVFDSDGTFSEGKWTRKDNRWLIQQTGTLADGTKSSATNIITQLDDNSFTWQSINREVAGELLPNVEEILNVREDAETEVEIELTADIIEAIEADPAAEPSAPAVLVPSVE